MVQEKRLYGYWICEVIGAEVKGEELTPLYSEAYSQSAEDFESESKQILKAVNKVSEATGKRGIYVIDRGGDRPEIIANIDKNGCRFVIRMRGDRHVRDANGNKMSLKELSGRIKCRTEYEVTINKEGALERHEVKIGV